MLLVFFQLILSVFTKRITPLLCASLLLAVISPAPASAGHLPHYANLSVDDSEEDDINAVPELHLPGVERVNTAHSYISSTVESLSQNIDSFFGEDRVYEEATGTYVQARSSLILNDDGSLDQDLKFRVKLRLPHLRSKFRLLIENDVDRGNFESFNSDVEGSNNLTNELDRSNLSASLQYMLKETENLNLSLRPGLKLSNPVEAFLRLRLAKEKQLNKRWLSRGTVQVGYFSEDGWENDWNLDFERRTGKGELFRTSTNVLWRDHYPGNQFLSETLLLVHVLNPRSSLAYELGITGETRPTLHNTTYFGNVRYRRNIHQGWLFLELKPGVVFDKENDYDSDLSVVVTLEVLFGKNYDY